MIQYKKDIKELKCPFCNKETLYSYCGEIIQEQDFYDGFTYFVPTIVTCSKCGWETELIRYRLTENWYRRK